MGHGDLGFAVNTAEVPDNRGAQPFAINLFRLTLDLVVCIDAELLRAMERRLPNQPSSATTLQL